MIQGNLKISRGQWLAAPPAAACSSCWWAQSSLSPCVRDTFPIMANFPWHCGPFVTTRSLLRNRAPNDLCARCHSTLATSSSELVAYRWAGQRKMAHRLARWATSEEGSNQRDWESRPARTLTGFMKIWRNAKNTQDSTTKTRIMLMRPFP